MKTAFLQFLLIVVLGTGFAVVAARSLAGPSGDAPSPAAAAEAITCAPVPGDFPAPRPS